jgi:alkaline phosphatase D
MAIARRGFLKSTAAWTTLLGANAVGCAHHPGATPVSPGADPFRHGVASGDPGPDRVILWTRVSPEAERVGEPIHVTWWVAEDSGGRDLVASGRLDARPERDFTVKVDAQGLEPGHDYHYGFRAGAFESPTGRTRTLPTEEVDRVRLGVTSCSNYPHGFFNAYACLAAQDDLDAVLHLGDYVYEYGLEGYGDGSALGRISDPPHEVLSLEDYRRRHAQYKTDPDLQAAHARHPWITVWDDHESANNSSRDEAENHSFFWEGSYRRRKLAAITAYYEWMPIRELPTGLFRQFRFGGLVDLVMLDTRLHGRDAPVESGAHEAAFEPERSLLGDDQTGWLLDALDDSKRAGTAWRVIGQQVIVSPLTDGRRPFNPDTWDGYRENRRQVLDHLSGEAIDDVVFLTGDYHSSWAIDVPPPMRSSQDYDAETGAGSRAVEFVTPAVSSRPLGAGRRALETIEAMRRGLPHVRYMNVEENGFLILDLTRERARAEFVFTERATTRSAQSYCGARFEARAGVNALSRQAGSSCGT